MTANAHGIAVSAYLNYWGRDRETQFTLMFDNTNSTDPDIPHQCLVYFSLEVAEAFFFCYRSLDVENIQCSQPWLLCSS